MSYIKGEWEPPVNSIETYAGNEIRWYETSIRNRCEICCLENFDCSYINCSKLVRKDKKNVIAVFI